MGRRSIIFFLGIATIQLLGGWLVTVRDPGGTGPYDLVYPAYFGNRINIPADNPLTREGVYLGRVLFYETRLSANNKVSCESCHQQRLAFTDGRAFSLGIDSIHTTRSSMSLTNLLWVRSFFWDGRVPTLEQQMTTPLTAPHEMGQSLDRSAERLRNTRIYPSLFRAAFGSDSITGDRIIKAIAQFERTLISADSRYDRYLRGQLRPDSAELRGMALFIHSPSPERNIRGANCEHCHASPKFFLDQFHNNGLDSVPADAGRELFTGLLTDRGRFRVPTLRNIALTAPYMHDGRFSTLEEVLDHYSEHIRNSASLSPVLQSTSLSMEGKDDGAGGNSHRTTASGLRLTGQEKKDIISFLRMLTDSTFITDTRFSNPHIHNL